MPGHAAAFDEAAIAHAMTRTGREEVAALGTFASDPMVQLRIENLLMQADRRNSVQAEVSQEVARRLAGEGRPALRLVHGAAPTR